MSSPRQSRHVLRNVALIAIGAALAFKFYDKEFLGVWAHLRAPWLFCAAGTAAVMICLRLAKWHLLLVEDHIPRGRSESIKSLLGAYALGSVTPGRLGDFGRFVFMGEGRRARTLLFTLVDKLFDLWAIVSLAVASLFVLVSWQIGAVALAGWLALIPIGIWAWKFAPPPDRVPRRLRQPLEVCKAAGHVSPRRFASWSLAAAFTEMTTLFFLLQAFHGAEFRAAFATYPWLVMAGSLPVSLGGVGPREGLSAVLLPIFAVPVAAAVNVSLVFFALTILAPSMLGGVWMALKPPALDRSWWRSLSNPGAHSESQSAPICS